MGGNDGTETGAIEDIAYLARSAQRVTVLSALGSGAYSPRDLETETGTARTTLSRILTEFEERGWAERTSDGTYTATSRGNLVAAEFERLVRSMETIERFDAIADVLPQDHLSIGVHHFSDATIHRSTGTEPAKIYDVWVDILQASDSMRMVAAVGPTPGLDAVIHEEIVSGGMSFEAVFSPDVYDLILSPETAYTPPEEIRAGYEAGARTYRAASEIPCNICVFDERVWISNLAADTAIETDDETVRWWAEAMFEDYRSAAGTPLTPADIPE